MGAVGGAKPTSKPKGFAANRDRARAAGKLGGMVSRRKPKIAQEVNEVYESGILG